MPLQTGARLDRTVAIKVLPGTLAMNPTRVVVNRPALLKNGKR